jgi:hypothetical protein
MHCTLRTLPPSPPHSNTHCHESSENFLYKIYQVLGILPILINNRSDTVVQWISAGLVWSRTWVQSYKKLDFFSVIGNRISNTSYHFQYLYYPGGNETGAKPNLITCITEIFLSASAWATSNSRDVKAVWSMDTTLTTAEPVFVNLLWSPGIDSQPGGPVQ